MAIRSENVGTGLAAVTPEDVKWVADRRSWARGWRLLVLPALFLAYLVYVGQGVAHYSHGAGAAIGYAVLAVFVACYLAIMSRSSSLDVASFSTSWTFWALYGGMVATFVAELPFARVAAFAMCLYITVITVARLGAWSVPVVVVLALSALLVPTAVPSWHESLSSAFDAVTPLALPVAAVVTFAVTRVHRANVAWRRRVLRSRSSRPRTSAPVSPATFTICWATR